MHDGSTQRRATLPGRAGSGERHSADHQFDVGRRCDDGRVVAAELEDAAPEPAGDHAGDLLAHAGRAGRADQGNAGVGHQGSADVGTTEQHLAEMTRCTDRLGGLLEQRVGGDAPSTG